MIMTKNMRTLHKTRFARMLLATIMLLLTLCILTITAVAAPTDKLRDFTITVDVNEDASLNMNYHIEWEVLDDSIGKLEWIDLGMPNKYHENIKAQSNTIDHIKDNGNSLAIYLDRPYGEGEVVNVDFSMTQDHMYQIDKWVEGETVYTFTPAWFDGMDIDNLTIRWNAQDAGAWQPDCLEADGYLTFDTSLSAGDKYTISVTYPNDAFGFVSERQATDSKSSSGSGAFENKKSSRIGIFEGISGLIGLVVSLGIFATPIILLFRFIRWIGRGAGFGTSQETGKKITRTKIEYYANCPNCGAPREEGAESCAFCGRSMIKSREVVEENQIEEPEKYTKNGTYRYGNSPNTFIHVNVINVPISRPRPPRSGGSSHRSSHHSSCASSCACASHCACASSCACACACASSGRAGCSVKDFFKKSIHEGRVKVRSMQ